MNSSSTNSVLEVSDIMKLFPELPTEEEEIKKFLDYVNNTFPDSDEDLVDFTATVPDQTAGYNVQVTMKENKRKRRLLRYADENKNPQAKVTTPRVEGEKPCKRLRIVIANLYGIVKENYKAKLQELGAKIVEKIVEADVLLISKRIIYSSKLLAAVCKGIPIVDGNFLLASIQRGKLVDPSDYVVSDFELEFRAGQSMKELVGGETKGSLFKNLKVYKSASSRLKFPDFAEIIENGGGKAVKIKAEIGKNEKCLYLFNENDREELRSIADYCGDVLLIKESDFINIILKQKLIY